MYPGIFMTMVHDDEQAAPTVGVLGVAGWEQRFDVNNAHTRIKPKYLVQNVYRRQN